MPVMLKTPMLVSSYQDTVAHVSLRNKGAVPEDAAIAILYYYNNTSQSGSGYWLCADEWFPGVDENTLVQDTGWAMDSWEKRMILVNLGPKFTNPDNNIWVGTYAGPPNVFCVGYFTYDEVVIFPEVTSDDRSDYTFNSDPGSGGWGNTTGWLEESIWNIPNMRQVGSDAPTGLIIDAMYDNMLIRARNARSDLLDDTRGYFKTASCLGGMNTNGDIWVHNTPGLSALMGYFITPIVWYESDKAVPKYTELWLDENETPLTIDKDAGFAIVELLDNTMEGWYVRGTHYSQNKVPHIGVGSTDASSRQDVIVQVDPDTHKFLVYGDSAWYNGPWGNIIRGYFKKVTQIGVDTSVELEEVEINAPEYYYPPDNIGSLHINYSVEGGSFPYEYVDDLKLYLSGGTTNDNQQESLGGQISTKLLLSGINGLFEDLSVVDSFIGWDDYRCLYLRNVSTTEKAVDVRLWIEKMDNIGDSNTILIGVDPVGINGQAQAIADGNSRPVDVSFILANSEASCYTVSVLKPGEYIALWFTRDVLNRATATASPDDVSIHLSVLDN